MDNTTRQITLAAIFVSLGVIIPLIIHTFGGGDLGKMFLPMHIPVLLAAFYLEPLFAVFVGIGTPILSTFLTGMPPIFPMMYVMILELGTYALCVSLLFRLFSKNKKIRDKKLHILLSLVISMVIGRIVSSFAIWVLVGNHQNLNLWKIITQVGGIYAGIVAVGIFGIIIQLILIPILVISTESTLIAHE